jgi:uncharacterized protein YjbJ (UPF0337 family)
VADDRGRPALRERPPRYLPDHGGALGLRFFNCSCPRGAVNKVKGVVKEAVGKVTGSKKMQAEGKLDKAKGTVQNAAGDVKDRARRATR